MSAYKFKKNDFDKLGEIYMFATECPYIGSIGVYELTDVEDTIYQEITILDSTLIAGVLTLLSNRPFDGQAVITTKNPLQDTTAEDVDHEKRVSFISIDRTDR